MSETLVVRERCDGCGACVPACPFLAIDVIQGRAVVAEICNGCGLCVPACPVSALVMPGENMAARGPGDFWVLAQEGLSAGAVRLFGDMAREVGARVIVVALPGFEESALAGSGASEVLRIPRSGNPAEALALAVRDNSPRLFAAVAVGEALWLMPQVAALAGLPCLSGARQVELSYGEEACEVTRPLFGSRYWVRIRAPFEPCLFLTLDPRGPNPPLSGLPGMDGFPWPFTVLDRQPWDARPPLAEAQVVLSGGEGLPQEGFAILEETAALLGGAPGASREAVAKGLAPQEWLVDTAGGKTVCPDLYMAFGIEGSPGHNGAVEESRVIVAVSPGENSNIRGICDYFVLADPMAVLRAFHQVGKESRPGR
ncbi:MAG: FAD-binding protein [Bacillota bacterium]